MLLKTISVILLTITLGVTSAVAGTNSQLSSLVGKQQVLSKKIARAYKNHEKSATMTSTIKALEAGQVKLKKYATHNAEVDNMFVFLNICLDEMKVLVKRPFSRENAQLVADLSASIVEGSEYIAKA